MQRRSGAAREPPASARWSARRTPATSHRVLLPTFHVRLHDSDLKSRFSQRARYRGVGRIVEVENLPGDPDNVLRDDLVFVNGSMHLVSTIVGGSQSLDPRTCRLTATIQQTGEVVGGTGEFAAASGSFAGELSGSATLARNPDGSCSQDTSRIETTEITSTGTLSF